MASSHHQSIPLDTPVSVRVSFRSHTRKFKLPLSDLNAQLLPTRLRSLLGIADNGAITIERFSDTVGSFVTLDSANSHIYKALFRAAKAKLKLRLRVTIDGEAGESVLTHTSAPQESAPSLIETRSSDTTEETMLCSPPASSEMPPPVANGSGIPFPGLNAQIARADNNLTMIHRVSTAKIHGTASHDRLESTDGKCALVVRLKQALPTSPSSRTWSVFCNACDKPIPNEHFHCNECNNGDFDLCALCLEGGSYCLGQGHRLVKRFMQDGQLVNSKTERLPRTTQPVQPLDLPEMPGAFTKLARDTEIEQDGESDVRTCNCCIRELDEKSFVTCCDCDDYDLCMECHESSKHGHHPGHVLEPVVSGTRLSPVAEFLCAPGRNIRHEALCDGCNKPIFGIRNKCLDCPDWDYCRECMKSAETKHPGHRFAPLYDPLPARPYRKARHVGVFCDGPLCEGKTEYIEGVRLKCAICHDTDFCGDCEANPQNKHNHTHPLIQFKTPVRNATITTVHEDQFGNSMAPKGDRGAAVGEAHGPPALFATQVHTVADVKPAESAASRPATEKIAIKDLLAEPIHEKIKVQDLLSSPDSQHNGLIEASSLKAVFTSETIADRSMMTPGQIFVKAWTMRNPGPRDWPSGCSVRFTGGDNMLHDVSTESNVVNRSVLVGEEVSFRVTLRTPQTKGNKISYWRLKAADGQAFGDRLWCHVLVADAAPSISGSTEPAASSSVSWHDNYMREALQHHFGQMRRAQTSHVRAQKLHEFMGEFNDWATQQELLMKQSLEKKRTAKAAKLVPLCERAIDAHTVDIPIKAALPATHTSALVSDVAKHEVGETFQELPAALPAALPAIKLLDTKLATPANIVAEDFGVNEACEDKNTPARFPRANSASAVRKCSGESAPKDMMIFPRLNKEIPPSVIEEASHAVDVHERQTRSPPKYESIFEADAESVDLVDSGEEEGSLTDEEYDILDASDEEIVF